MPVLFVCMCGSCIWPQSRGPRHDAGGGNVGVGVFSVTEAALSETRFLCSKFHYIRVQEGGGGVKRQLVYGTGTQ